MARFLVAVLLMLGLGAVVFNEASDLDRQTSGASVSQAEGGSGFPPPNLAEGGSGFPPPN